jgi:hypothetical protein
MSVSHPTIQTIRREDAAMRKWFPEVCAAAAAFESRWTWLSLMRVNKNFAGRLRAQLDLYDVAMAPGGSVDDIEAHAAAMCRGYVAACRVMERAGAPDDAYQLGSDPNSGTRVAIGIQKAATVRVELLQGQSNVIWISPDEVAVMIASSVDTGMFIATVKRTFPGSVMS